MIERQAMLLSKTDGACSTSTQSSSLEPEPTSMKSTAPSSIAEDEFKVDSLNIGNINNCVCTLFYVRDTFCTLDYLLWMM